MSGFIHGMTNTEEYAIWSGIKTRCYNPKSISYSNYGGAGIGMSDEWKSSFEQFYEDMGSRPSSTHSVDRVDGRKDYSKENCRWATYLEQANNKRNNRVLMINGTSKTLAQWAREAGITSSAIINRIKAGGTGAELIRPTERGGTITFRGITDTAAGWSNRTGIKKSTIAMRLTKYGWSVERTLTEGVKF